MYRDNMEGRGIKSVNARKKSAHISHFFHHVHGKPTYEMSCTTWVEFLKYRTRVLIAYFV